MNKLYTMFFAMFFIANFAQAQNSYLTAGNNFTAVDVFTDYDMLSTFDICDGLLYAHTGDTIIIINMFDGSELFKYGKPADYNAFPSFVFANPSKNEIWAGFTVTGNTDDRVYCIDTESGLWEHKATLAGNFDMEIVNDNLIVDGAIYGEGNIIYLLDTTGTNNHRAIVETTGNSAGIASDKQGNLYFGTSFTENNMLLRWSNSNIQSVMSNSGAAPLQITDAEKLADLPVGAYDCDIDNAGNLVFNINDYAANKSLVMWNGTIGDGANFDTLAYTADGMDWLTMVKTTGNVLDQGDENGAFVLSYARPIAKINGTIIPPQQTQEFEVVQQSTASENLIFDLNNYFSNPNNREQLSYSVVSNSFANVALAEINENNLTIDFIEAGQTAIIIEVSNGAREITAQIIVGVHDEIMEDYTIANFEDLELAENSYWNGANGEGYFQSANILFSTSYNTEYSSWGQWVYSSTTDNTTPGYMNQYSAITGAGFEATNYNSGTYGVAYASSWDAPVMKFADNQAHIVKGFYATNSTYAGLSMRDGDAYSKKFGGASGNDPDWFKLSVYGFYNGMPTDTVDFYLADFRFDEAEKDYIFQTWQWVELTQLGYVDSLQMVLNSSDVGDWGMNTPAYFCADNFYIGQGENNIVTLANKTDFSVYPNPANSQITIHLHDNAQGRLTIIDATGAVVMQENQIANGEQINISNLASGLYFVQIQSQNNTTSKRLIKQ